MLAWIRNIRRQSRRCAATIRNRGRASRWCRAIPAWHDLAPRAIASSQATRDGCCLAAQDSARGKCTGAARSNSVTTVPCDATDYIYPLSQKRQSQGSTFSTMLPQTDGHGGKREEAV